MDGEKGDQPGQEPDPAHEPSQPEGLNMKSVEDRQIEAFGNLLEGMEAGENPEDYLKRIGAYHLTGEDPLDGLEPGRDAQPEEAPSASGDEPTTPAPATEQTPITAGTPGIDIAKYVDVESGARRPSNPPLDTEFSMADVRASGGASPDLPQSAPTDPPVLSYMDAEDRGGAEYGLNEDAIERNRNRRAAAARVAAVVGVVLLLGAGGFALFGGGGDSNDTTSSGNRQAAGQVAAVATATPAATATPTPTIPTAFRASAEQTRNANLIATDLAAIFGTCAYALTTNGATDVAQAVSSSPAMMQAMADAGYQGARNVSGANPPCQGLPYNAASVSGNARDVAAAQALFAAARTNYQALFPGFKTVDVQRGQLDEFYCQYGVYPPNNIIAIACWLRKGLSVTGIFILLPPNSQQPVIDEAVRDMVAVVQRVDGVLR